MKLRGLLKFLRLLLFAETASDVAERSVGRKRLRIDSFLGFFRRRSSQLIFLRLHLRAIFRRENLIALELLFGVDVLGFLLLTFLRGKFLTNRFGDSLTRGPRGAKSGEGHKEKPR